MSIKHPWMVALLVVACCYGSLALAELTPVDPKTRQDIVFQILAQIANRVTSWEAQITSAASYLFWTLGTISLSWTMGMMILKRADLGEFFAEFIRFIFFFGLFYALLRQGPNIARLILESMLQLGQEAAGSTIKYQSFISIGTELMSRADQFQQTGASEKDSLLVVGLCGGILLMLTTMVINLFLVFVAGWFLMYAGIFFLGFGGSRWTSDIAIGYYKAVIAIGIQMFVMALIMGIATDVLGDFFEKFSFDMRFYELMSFLVATFAFMTIFNRIPTLLSGLVSGASIGTSQGELGGALRGANGADPFGAGRSALGTAAGGAQKLFAAMTAGLPNGRIQNPDSLISIPAPRNEPTGAPPMNLGVGLNQGTMQANTGSPPNFGSGGASGRGTGADGKPPAVLPGKDGAADRGDTLLKGGSTKGIMASVTGEERGKDGASPAPGQSVLTDGSQRDIADAGSTAGATPSAPVLVAQNVAPDAAASSAPPSGTDSGRTENSASSSTRSGDSPAPAPEAKVARLEGATSVAPASEESQSLSSNG